MKNLNRIVFLIASVVISSCNSGTKQAEEPAGNPYTPVTVTSVMNGPLTDTVMLNATSAFLLKTSVKAVNNGYLKDVNIRLGESVKKGEVLFTLSSKEGSTIGNTINSVDTSFHFTGLMPIKSPGDGFVTRLGYLAGDYVQEGETLAEISNMNSLVFLLNLPYELKPFLHYNNRIMLYLPDGQKISGKLSSSLPFVDPESQTQNYIIYMDKYQAIPENLVARVSFIRNTKSHTVSLPKDAVLTNEQQSEFWIMKMIDSTTAVKVAVTKGLETAGRIEILSPRLELSDVILLTGNYGLPDTAHVIIEKN
jgi:multidrug efflux pump subunit AcrA (membrane-fusion protein)